ncbi:universal stress protein [Actinomadura craniellae]|uniref:Universal stress protein n=1 Tax=Actinomadura craniellae TaxID=2231787 RepID=A0A365H3T5_9ACTN|nr:universal stress protein [Actinomadura craniellae]RAY13775.1 universal stress protein [Actinomadura craniellae]
MRDPIIVGVDGSERARRAIDWAAAEAELHDLPVRLVNASMLLVRDGSLTEEGYARQDATRTELLEEARDRVLRRAPGLEVTTDLLAGEPGRALLDESENASMLVLGSRGVGGFEGLLLGSVSLHVAARATRPVVVVPLTAPDPADAPAEIVVGVDEDSPAGSALDWAYREADLRKARLTSLYAVGGVFGAPEQQVGEGLGPSPVLAEHGSRYPGVQVSRTVVDERPGSSLVTASERAALVVVGAHRQRGILGLGLGRTNHTVLHHSRCPIVVVPEPERS